LSIIANESNLTATTVTLDADQDIVITGDEDVDLGTVATANSINSQGSTGNTTATLGAAAKSISSGSGADTITLSGNRIHTVDSGSGIDTLTITSTAATSTINAGAGDDAVTVTDLDQYVVLGGDGADNINVGVASGATLMGGAGSDTLTITAGGVTLAAGFLTNSVENLNLNASNGTTAFTSTQFAGLAEAKITGNTTTDVLQVTATAAGGAMDYSGLTETTASTQTVNYILGAGADTVTGTSAFSETFNMNNLKGVDAIAGGAGTGNVDTITTNDSTYKEVATSTTSSGIIVNLGDAAVSGVNILSNAASHLADGVTSVAGGTITQLYALADTTKVNSNVVDTVSGIENFTSSDAAGIEYVVGTSGNNVINVGAGADYVDGGAGNDTITGGAGADKLVGGDGDDTFIISDATVDTITGGLGSLDTLSINGGVTLATSDDFAGSSGLEKLIASGATTNAISFSAHADFVTDTGILTYDLSADTNATGTNVIDLSGLTNTLAITVTGSAGIDQITLDAGDASTVKGGTGLDVIDFSGGTTADTIDVTSAHSATNNYDTVANMNVTHDKIKLDGTATTLATASGAAAVVEDEATAAANSTGATYDLAAALTLNTNAVDLVTLDTAVLANKANANLDAGGTINDGTELLKCLVAAGVGRTASSITVDNAGDEFYILTDDGIDSYLYYANSGANTTVVAAEIQLVFDAAGVLLDSLTATEISIA
jgi:Ca2+-binding RTX toxin-like protein